MDAGEGVYLVYPDFAKAFESVNHRMLCDNMHVYGIHQIIVDWTLSFLFIRIFKVRVAESLSARFLHATVCLRILPWAHPVFNLRQ